MKNSNEKDRTMKQTKVYQAIYTSIGAEAWDSVWEDSFLLRGGKRIRKVMRCDNGEASPSISVSMVRIAADEAFSGCYD